jgi:hypothetical protein
MFRRINTHVQQSRLFLQGAASFRSFSSSSIGQTVLSKKHHILGVGVASLMIVTHRQQRAAEADASESKSHDGISSSDKGEDFFFFSFFFFFFFFFFS